MYSENAEQMLKLDKALQKCSALIIQDFTEKGEPRGARCGNFDLRSEWVDALEDQFMKADFYGKDAIDVVGSFENTMYPLIEINVDHTMKVLYPVLFYTSVLKNFHSRNTINHRIQRGSRYWGITEDLLKVPSAREDSKMLKTAVSLREEIEQLMVEVEGKRGLIAADLKDEDDESLLFLLNATGDLLVHAETVLYMLQDGRISWLKTMAKRAMFARNILESQMKYSKPAEILLRLYVLDAIDGVVGFSELLSNGCRDEEVPKCDLLTSFLKNNEISADVMYSPVKRKKLLKMVRTVSLEQEQDLSNDGAVLYEELAKLKLADLDMDDVLDYFFDPYKLNWYQNFEEELFRYAEAVAAGLRRGENIDERYFRFERFCVIRGLEAAVEDKT